MGLTTPTRRLPTACFPSSLPLPAAADRNARRDRGATSARRTPPRGPQLQAEARTLSWTNDRPPRPRVESRILPSPVSAASVWVRSRWTDVTRPNPDCWAARGSAGNPVCPRVRCGRRKVARWRHLSRVGPVRQVGGFPPLIERLQSDATRALSQSVPSAPDGTAAFRQWPRAF